MKTGLLQMPRTVFVLGLASFFTDVSSEMIYPLLPAFLLTVLGVGALEVGFIEGFAESTSSILKVVSGVWTDRFKKRKPFVVAGYILSSLFRPLIGIATVWPAVFALRFFDRVGKGIRTSPRDAMIADVVHENSRGHAYGFHRAMDHAGAVVGPLVATALLLIPGMSLNKVFLLAGVPALLTILVLIFFLKEKEPAHQQTTENPTSFNLISDWRQFQPNFKKFLIAVFIFSLGNSADAFLLVRLTEQGIPTKWIPALWAAFHVVKMLSTYFGGRLCDHYGRRPMIISGWVVYIAVYLLFGLIDSPQLLVALLFLYGIYFGFTEPAERALVVDLVPSFQRGTAFGYFHFIVGIGTLPASIIFGAVWKFWGPAASFILGATFAAVALILLLRIQRIMTSTHKVV